MVTYPGLPVPVVSDWLPRDASQARYAPGTTFQIGKIELLANTGTYIDAPFHRYDGGKDVADYPLEAAANLEGIVVRATERAGRAPDAGAFRGRDVAGKAALVHTGRAVHGRTERSGAGVRGSGGVTARAQHNDTASDNTEGAALCRALDCHQFSGSMLREVRVVLLLDVRQGQAQLCAVDTAAPWHRRHSLEAPQSVLMRCCARARLLLGNVGP